MKKAHRAWLMPLIIAALFISMFALMFGPMMNMKPHDLPVAAVMNDQGVDTPKGHQVAGEKVLDTMDEKFSESGALKMEKVEDGEFNANDYFAVITIPEDFTKQMSSHHATVDFKVNQGKNPMAAMQLQQMVTKIDMGDSGVVLKPDTYNSIDPKLGFAANMIPTVLIMMTMVPSIVGGNLASSSTRRWLQPLLAALVAIFVGLAASAMITWVTPLTDWNAHLALYLAVGSFCMGMLTIGAINLLGRSGLILPVACVILGMSTGMLPREFLPGFWSDFVWLWNPVHNLANGVRNILFLHQTWSGEAIGLLTIGGVGVILWALSALRRTPASMSKDNGTPSEDAAATPVAAQ